MANLHLPRVRPYFPRGVILLLGLAFFVLSVSFLLLGLLLVPQFLQVLSCP